MAVSSGICHGLLWSPHTRSLLLSAIPPAGRAKPTPCAAGLQLCRDTAQSGSGSGGYTCEKAAFPRPAWASLAEGRPYSKPRRDAEEGLRTRGEGEQPSRCSARGGPWSPRQSKRGLETPHTCPCCGISPPQKNCVFFGSRARRAMGTPPRWQMH